MSRRFSMTSNPVRASESQDEAEPLLGDAEKKCDDVVEAIGFGNWSLLLVILLGFLFMGDSIEATLLSFLYDCVGGAFDLNPFEASTVISIVFAWCIRRNSIPRTSGRRRTRSRLSWGGSAASRADTSSRTQTVFHSRRPC